MALNYAMAKGLSPGVKRQAIERISVVQDAWRAASGFVEMPARIILDVEQKEGRKDAATSAPLWE